MSAAEVIEQIKKLPAEEVRAIRDYLQNEGNPGTDSVEYVPLNEVKRAADEMFNRYPELFRKLAQ
jgi:hypothetical protein